MLKYIIAALALGVAAPAAAQDFTPGRPGATESPIAVPQGRWQIETEIAGFATDDDSDVDTLSLAETTFRYGLARGTDAELIVAPYTHVDTPGGDDSGFGDVTLRLRHTYAGLDGEGPSFGVIAYVTLPTAEDGFGAEEVEGGLIAAGGIDLSEAWDLTWTIGAGAVSDGDDYDVATSGGVAFGHGLTERFGYYVEAFAEHLDGETAAQGTLGVTYLWDELTQLDANVDIGLNDNADDVRFSIGWAHLF